MPVRNKDQPEVSDQSGVFSDRKTLGIVTNESVIYVVKRIQDRRDRLLCASRKLKKLEPAPHPPAPAHLSQERQLQIGDIATGLANSAKRNIAEKTGVPADRINLLAKSKGLRNDISKDDCNLQTMIDGAEELLLLGSAMALPASPKTKAVKLWHDKSIWYRAIQFDIY